MLLGVLAPWPFFLLGFCGGVDACPPSAVALDLSDLAGEIVIDLPTGADECHEGAGAAGGVVEVDKDALGALIPDFDRVFERIDGADGILCDKKFVSIRAPREGRDPPRINLFFDVRRVSIRAPREGRDVSSSVSV